MVIGVFIGLAVGAALAITFVAAKGGGWSRAMLGLSAAGRAAHDPAAAAKLAELAGGPPPAPAVPPPPPAPPKPSGAPLRLLAHLQAESRLVDFLFEDISAAGDAQIGQAVRKMHADAQAALKKVVVVAPVLSGSEGEQVTVAAGFDPSAVRVLGNVTGQPPYRGELQHPGWKVTELKLAPPAAGQDEFVLQPAEVQLP